VTYRYYRCVGDCRRVMRTASAQDCCGFAAKFITDVEARELIEGRPFKGRRTKLTGKIQSRADTNKFRYSRVTITRGRSRESGEK
jgi:hypothetical protein